MERIWSKRNFIFISKKYGPILYVGNTNNIVGLSQVDFSSIHKFITCKNELPQNLSNQLYEIGALEDSNLFNIFEYGAVNSAFDPNHMELWICMTNTCNFKCTYCFEKNTPVFLNESIIKKIITFIQKHQQVRYLLIHLYGGEPLLNLDGIFQLKNEIEKLTNITTKYDIVTNGYLLSIETFDKLLTIKDLKFQITLDGLEKTHNKRRPHKTENDSYKKILANLDTIYQKYKTSITKPSIAIRFNADKENMNDFHKLYEFFLNKYNGFFYFYSTTVQDYCTGGEQYYSNMFTPEQYSQFLLDIYEKYGIFETPIKERFKPDVTCGAAKKNFYCISSEGLVYKCPSEVGHSENAIFDLKNDAYINKSIKINYFVSGNPLSDETCKNCFLLFQCMGVCAKHVFYTNKFNSKHNCIPLKYNTEKHIENMFKQQLSEKINIKGGIYDFTEKENC
jgi:uncharacterized protein